MIELIGVNATLLFGQWCPSSFLTLTLLDGHGHMITDELAVSSLRFCLFLRSAVGLRVLCVVAPDFAVIRLRESRLGSLFRENLPHPG